MDIHASLQPFAPEPHLQPFQLSAAASWCDQQLQLRFHLRGPLQTLVIPDPVPRPRRRDGLWQNTCFEAFVAIPDQPAYWELNLAPCGDWNVYALRGYRQDLQAEPRIGALPCRWRRGEELELELELELDLRQLMPAATGLELSATAVLEHRQHGCSHWAWRHGGPVAGFDRRASFQRLNDCNGRTG